MPWREHSSALSIFLSNEAGAPGARVATQPAELSTVTVEPGFGIPRNMDVRLDGATNAGYKMMTIPDTVRATIQGRDLDQE